MLLVIIIYAHQFCPTNALMYVRSNYCTHINAWGARFDATYKKAFVSKDMHVRSIIQDSGAICKRFIEVRIM